MDKAYANSASLCFWNAVFGILISAAEMVAQIFVSLLGQRWEREIAFLKKEDKLSEKMCCLKWARTKILHTAASTVLTGMLIIMLRILRQCYLCPESKRVSVFTWLGVNNCLSYVLGSFMLFSKDKYYFLIIFDCLCGKLHFSMHFKFCQHAGRLKLNFSNH